MPLPRPRKLPPPCSPSLCSRAAIACTLVSVGHLQSLLPSPPSGGVTKSAPFSRSGGVFGVHELPGGMGSTWPCGLREGFGGHWSSVCQVSHQAPFPLQEETLGWGLCFSKTLPSDLTQILPAVSFTLKVGMETCCLWAREGSRVSTA